MPPAPPPNMPDLKGSSLSGGSDNKQLQIKSRSGHLVTLDDNGCTIRMQDRSGNATVSLENGVTHIVHKTGDIMIYARELFRIDCTDMEVRAGNDILFNAGKNVTTSVKGSTTVNAGKNIFGSAKKDTVLATQASFMATSGTETMVISNKQLSLGSEGALLNVTCGGKVSIGSRGDLSLKANTLLSITAAAGADFKTNGECNIRGSATVTVLSNCINLN